MTTAQGWWHWSEQFEALRREGDAFDVAATAELPQARLEAEAAALRARLEHRTAR